MDTRRHENRKVHFSPNFGYKIFLEASALLDLDIVPSYNLVQYQGNMTIEPSENCKNPNFGPTDFFSRILLLLVVRQGFKLSTYAILRRTNEQNLRKWQKKLILGLILAHFGQNLVTKIFFRGLYL